MRSLKHGLMAAAALTIGMAMTVPSANAAQGAQAGTQIAQAAKKPAMAAKKPAMAKPMSRRAQRDAAERETTKKLNEQQLQRR